MKTALDNEAAVIAGVARALATNADYDSLVGMAGEAQCVLIGEASHGTHEFYAIRAALTRRLIEEKGFRAVALEADWPDSFCVHRFVTGRSDDTRASEALSDFRRFPSWMWRNTVVVDFVEWLGQWNARNKDNLAGFYGLDLYSLHTSIEAVLNYLNKIDPAAARRARLRYACFDHFGQDPQQYGLATVAGGAEPCEDDVAAQLTELRRKYVEFIQRDGHIGEEEFFSAEQNARLVMNAERYYRAMFHGRARSWNLRDQHMFETLSELFSHLDRGRAKVAVWAHNSHLGDARATEMHARGELNMGQLAREHFGERVFAIGFSTYCGTVTAASDWGAPAERKRVRPALAGSYEALFHAAEHIRFLLTWRDNDTLAVGLREPRLERAIGVIYRSETERQSHYFRARLPDQFDAVLHFDETRAVKPLEATAEWEAGEVPETFPFAV